MDMTREAFDRLVQEHERTVRALAMAYCRDDHAADDVVQDTFWRAWRSVDGLRDPSALKTWLYALARHTALDHLRARRRRATEELNMHVAAPEKEEKGDLVDRVVRAVDGLREDYRQILLLRYVEKLSYAEIGEALGLKPGAVGEKLHRVRKMVMEKFGL